MDLKKVALISIPIAVFVIAILAYTSLFMTENKGNYESKSWKISIVYPRNATGIEGSGALGISTYTISLTISFFSGGQLNETNLMAGPLGFTEIGNSSIILRPAKTPKVIVYTNNRTVIIQGDYKSGLYAAVDRFLLLFSGKYAIGLDSSKKYLTIIHPDKGTKYGIPWLGKFSVEEVKRVPVEFHGSSEVNLMDLILGPFTP